MKKLLALLLALVMVVSVAACGNSEPANSNETETEQTENVSTESTEEEAGEETEATEEEKPSTTPAEKPQEKPQEKPTQTPEPSAPQTVGNKLLAEFKSKANSGSAYDIANAIATGGSLPFMAGAMEVEPGLLSGFDNFEVNGFKSGASFGPMIGSIAFIGYVFELEDGVSAASFISNLKSNANLRWNICVEAEEMVAGSSGNKVFFVMCPKAFEE